MANEHVKSILALTRKEYTDNQAAWERNEKRFRAGEDVYDELRAFQWETAKKAEDTKATNRTLTPQLDSYQARQEAAVCIEFAAMTKEKFGGLVFQHFPQAHDGGLQFGNLASAEDGWRAAALMRNADGTGSNARSLDAFWRDEMEMSVATRYRWIFAEAPAGGASSREEEEMRRPYFVGFSPLQVPYWYEDRGNLQCVRVVLSEQRPQVSDDGTVEHATMEMHYLMTREGFTGWGTSEEAGDDRFRFDEGGWWIVDDNGDIVEHGETPLYGSWEATGGEIPMAPLYYERGVPGNKDTGITHLGRIQVEFMNQLSAMFYDSWNGGSGVLFFAGADNDQWNTIRNAGLTQGRWIPIPPKTSETGSPSNVRVVAQSAFDASPAIKNSLEWLLKLATQLIIRELTTSPDASGAARQLEFLQGNTPRLSNIAGNLEECMTTMHRFLEMRWGYSEPESSVTWTRHFDLRTTLEKIRGVLDIMSLAAAKSPTLISRLILQAVRSEGLLPETDSGEPSESTNGEMTFDETVEDELMEGLRQGAQQADALDSFLGGI